MKPANVAVAMTLAAALLAASPAVSSAPKKPVPEKIKHFVYRVCWAQSADELHDIVLRVVDDPGQADMCATLVPSDSRRCELVAVLDPLNPKARAVWLTRDPRDAETCR